MTNKSDTARPTAPTVIFDYIKGCNFRPVRVDGAIGGVTPNGHIHMALYTERHAIPRRVRVEIGEDDQLGAVREVETRGSIVREMEVDVFLNLKTAESILAWLEEKIHEAKEREK